LLRSPALGAVRLALVWGAVAFASLAAGGCGGGGSSPVVAEVGGREITRAMLAHWIVVEAAVERRTGRSDAAKAKTLEFLIRAEWTLGGARELGVRVSDAEVRKQLELFRFDRLEGIAPEAWPAEADLQRILETPGVSVADQLWAMKLGLLAARIDRDRLEHAEQAITRKQIGRYYRQHRRSFGVPETRDIEIIETFGESAARKAKREIEAGQGFLAVARRLSVDPVARDGLKPHVTRGEGARSLAAAIFAARPHVLIGPLSVSLYYLFEVLRITRAHEQPLGHAEASIRRRLAARLAGTTLLRALQRKWIARTSCRSGFVVMGCRGSG
jgi:SurA N-terminal domain